MSDSNKLIGIMSMQRIVNYGSFMQAYALKKCIESLGLDVTFVDYKVGKPLADCKTKRTTLIKLNFNRCFRRFACSLWFLSFLFPNSIKQYVRSTHNYKKYLLNCLYVDKKKVYNKQVDVLIIGSDEVFNCTQHNLDVGFSPELFGKNSNAKRLITYAASFGNTTLSKINGLNIKTDLSSYLNAFDELSVRDDNSCRIVLELTGKTPSVNLDPVLIYNFSNEIIEQSVFDNYVLVYAYRGRITKEEIKTITSFARNKNKKIIAIGGYHKFADVNMVCSPFEVLGYFKKADYIFTDTFHGSIFSIINHKKFVTFVREKGNGGYGNAEKLADLLERLKLKSRSVADDDDIISVLESDIDYSLVDSVIADERKKAFNYLTRNLCEVSIND